MTLFIASLIIYQFDMNPWLYVLAAVIWAARPFYRFMTDLPTRSLIDTILNHIDRQSQRHSRIFLGTNV